MRCPLCRDSSPVTIECSTDNIGTDCLIAELPHRHYFCPLCRYKWTSGERCATCDGAAVAAVWASIPRIVFDACEKRKAVRSSAWLD